MADQGVFWKLWCSALEDPDLDNLDIADFGRWAKLGAYLKKHGEGGQIAIRRPAKTLLSMLQLPDFDAFLMFLQRISHVHVMSENDSDNVTSVIVTFSKWHKYQVDNSVERVRRFRQNVTTKKRGEEKRREVQKKKTYPPVPLAGYGPPTQNSEPMAERMDERTDERIAEPMGAARADRGTDGRTDGRTDRRADRDPDVKAFIDHAFEVFLAKTGERMLIDGGKDGAIVKKLLRTYGLNRLKGLWDVFMRSDDPFILRAGFSIGVFKSQINKLLVAPEPRGLAALAALQAEEGR